MDRPESCSKKPETIEQRSSSEVCSQAAIDLMRTQPQGQYRPVEQGQTYGRPENYPPAMDLRDGAASRNAGDNAQLQGQTAVLFNPNASPEQKLACVQSLCDAGLKELTYQDQTGEHKLRLEKIPVGADGRAMVHLFGTDQNGQQQTILRGISQADGSFKNEQNPQGQAVDFYGRGRDLLNQNQNPNSNPNKLDCPNPYNNQRPVDDRYGQNQNQNNRALPDIDQGIDYSKNPFDLRYRNPNQNDNNPDSGYRARPEYGNQDSGYRPDPNADSQYRQNPYERNPYERNPYQRNPYERNPSDQNPIERGPENRPYNGDNNVNNSLRSPSDRNSFYAHQNDGYSCSAFSMAMMASDWNTGCPPSGQQSSNWKQIAGTIGQGYRGSLNTVASNLREGIPGLQTKVYNYGMGRVGQGAMQDLNRELDSGHTAVAKVINPHTGNAHYIYIAGRTQDGQYLLGDPDRKNPHQQPISGDRLMHMMSRRDGFVAGWKESPSAAARVQGSAANRYAMKLASNGQRYES